MTMNSASEVIRAVFESYINYTKVYSDNPEKPAIQDRIKELERVRDEVISCIEIPNKEYAIKKIEEDIANKIYTDLDDLDVVYDNDYFSSNREPMFLTKDVYAVIDKYRKQGGIDEETNN